MRLLLDTHVYLWWLDDDPRLSEAARDAVADGDAIVHVSAVSVWEAAIKVAAGRLDIGPTDLVGAIPANSFIELPVNMRHAVRAGTLPLHHRDPFDRMLVAQAQLEDLTLVSFDPALTAYNVSILR